MTGSLPKSEIEIFDQTDWQNASRVGVGNHPNHWDPNLRLNMTDGWDPAIAISLGPEIRIRDCEKIWQKNSRVAVGDPPNHWVANLVPNRAYC